MRILRKPVPWWLIIAAKITVSRVPLPYSFWKRLRLFNLGDMDIPERAFENFLHHARSAGVLDEKSSLPRLRARGNFNVLELGPGDSLFTIIIANALGASRTWLVDAGFFATTDMPKYNQMLDFLRQRGFVLPFKKAPKKIDAILDECNGEYLTGGVSSLAKLPSGTVDFCFSQTVLQHIPKNDFTKMVDELFRVSKPNGICVHRVDMKDCMGGGELNNLRFSEAMWEGALFRKSGFYTNRIRFREMVEIFEKAGFKCALPRIVRWKQLPTPREKLDPEFRRLPDEDLLVSGFDMVLKKTNGVKS
jgi:SAM-dependent methyltransferase